MKRMTTGVLAAALLLPALTACGGDEDFCTAAPEDFNSDDPAAMKEVIEDAKDSAPDELQDDLDVIIEQLDLIESDPANLDVDAMTKAADELVKWEEANC